MRSFWKTLVVLLCVGSLLTSCQKEPSENLQKLPDGIPSNSVLGKKLENPYSVANMQKAWDNLYGEQRKETISASHYYIKFLPSSEDDLTLLHNDTLLDLYQYPLDYEIIEGSTTYQDPTIPEGTPTPLYASIPVTYDIPNVDFEVLEELFIPEELENNNGKFSYEELLREAYRITNNIYDDGFAKDDWTPSGSVKAYDTNKGCFVPVSGAKVKARRWFTTYTGITGSNGNFTCDGSFSGNVNYSLDFERYDFEIRDGWLSTATINGPQNKKGAWNLQIYDAEPRFWATIFRAASHYYFGDIHGLRRPPQNAFWNTQLKIRAHYENTESYNGYHSPALRFLGLGSAIHIYNPERQTCLIYGTTIHELAHASHWNMSSGGDYTNSDDIVAESWARGVQWELTRMVYPNLNLRYDYSRRAYTGIVEDLIDGIKESYSYYYYTEDDPWKSLTKHYPDRVQGYTIKQLEDALLGQRTWQGWKNNIKTLYNNATENYLDNAFNHWAD